MRPLGQFALPEDFRRSLEAHLKNVAEAIGWDIERVRRQLAFKRLLARLFATAESKWILKGGTALELRYHQSSRSTKDLDLVFRNQVQDVLL